MQKRFSVKDESRYTRRWGPDGRADDSCDEDYAVINFRGEEVFRTPSRIEAERWIQRCLQRWRRRTAHAATVRAAKALS